MTLKLANTYPGANAATTAAQQTRHRIEAEQESGKGAGNRLLQPVAPDCVRSTAPPAILRKIHWPLDRMVTR